MHKTPVAGTHTKARGLWQHRPRVEQSTNGEVTEKRARLSKLITATQEKVKEIGAIMKEKAVEQAELKKEFAAAFVKTPGIAHQKALAKTKRMLENHLHHTMCVLDLKKGELKEIFHEVNSIKEHLRKNLVH